MASQEDCESHQEFSVASFAVPSRAELEERVVLAMNLKDGQQSCTQDSADPYTKAVHYVEKHRIVEIFQVSMETTHTHTTEYTAWLYCSLMQLAHVVYVAITGSAEHHIQNSLHETRGSSPIYAR